MRKLESDRGSVTENPKIAVSIRGSMLFVKMGYRLQFVAFRYLDIMTIWPCIHLE